MHPETKAEVFKGNQHTGKVASENSAFTSDAANKTGKSRRTVEIAAARGEALGDDLAAIAGTSLDKGVEMDALAKMPASERASVIARAVGGENVSARKTVPIDPYIKQRAVRAGTFRVNTSGLIAENSGGAGVRPRKPKKGPQAKP